MWQILKNCFHLLDTKHNENEMDIVKASTITLKKATSQEETEFLNNHETVNKIISNYTKNNNQGQQYNYANHLICF